VSTGNTFFIEKQTTFVLFFLIFSYSPFAASLNVCDWTCRRIPKLIFSAGTMNAFFLRENFEAKKVIPLNGERSLIVIGIMANGF
jgi:hypothetical protein